MNQEDFLILEERKVSRKLRRANYAGKKDTFPFRYLLRHKKTTLVIEVNGCSVMHACKMAGWRPRDAEVLEKTPLDAGETTV
jgi:hypothetical protein